MEKVGFGTPGICGRAAVEMEFSNARLIESLAVAGTVTKGQ